MTKWNFINTLNQKALQIHILYGHIWIHICLQHLQYPPKDTTIICIQICEETLNISLKTQQNSLQNQLILLACLAGYMR